MASLTPAPVEPEEEEDEENKTNKENAEQVSEVLGFFNCPYFYRRVELLSDSAVIFMRSFTDYIT